VALKPADFTKSLPASGPASDLLVACALEKEASALLDRLPQLPILATGLGARATRRVLERRFAEQSRPRLLLFTGTAGQLDPSVAMGDVICPERWLTEDGRRFESPGTLVANLRNRGWDVAGDGLTIARPVFRASSRRRKFEETGARICDMEAAAALDVATRYGVPALAPKVVSDTGDAGVAAYWTHFSANMMILADYLRRLWPTLLEALRNRGL
jgi:nucleoside phosphorylase